MTRPAENTRGSIIKAAVHLFAENGFQGASMRGAVMRERIRQIEAKALRKLKHPSRSRELRSFLDS